MHNSGDFRDKFINQIDPIVITDLLGVILEVNSKFMELTGVNHDEVFGQYISRYAQGVETVLQNAFQNYDEMSLSGAILHTVDGDVVLSDLLVCLVSSENGQYLQWTFRFSDAAFQQEEYTTMLVHDLRTPLSNIITSLELLDTLPPVSSSSDAKEVIQIAQRSAAQLSDDLSNLLDSHHILSGRSLIRTEWIEMSSIIQEAAAMLKPGADAHLQTIQYSPCNIPRIRADADMLRRVITNLLENAVKSSPADSEISVSAESSDEALVIKVTNFGLAAGGQPKVQVDRQSPAHAQVREPRGYGLGLAFCEMALRAHGGELKRRINRDGSRTYSIILPLDNNFDLTGTIKEEV